MQSSIPLALCFVMSILNVVLRFSCDKMKTGNSEGLQRLLLIINCYYRLFVTSIGIGAQSFNIDRL